MSAARTPCFVATADLHEGDDGAVNDHDRGFETYLRTQHKLTLVEVRKFADATRERTLRSDYARYSAVGYDDLVGSTECTSHDLRYTKKYIELEAYAQLARDGTLFRLSKMSRDDKIEMFGVPTVPIYVPLARGESAEQYEARFLTWLRDSKRTTLHQVAYHHNPLYERVLRMQFAGANAHGEVAFQQPREQSKHGHQDVGGTISYRATDSASPPPRKRRREDVRSSDTHTSKSETPTATHSMEAKQRGESACDGQMSIPACMACGCRQCLLGGMRLLAAKIDSFALNSQTHEPTATIPSSSSSSISESGHAVDDEIESQLIAEYDAINDQIVMNEKVLDASAIRLAPIDGIAIDAITQLQDENQEMRELIQDECGSRTTALAMVIVYLWRHDIDDLKEMIHDSTATDIRHIQRASHHTCAQLAIEIADKREQLAAIDHQDGAVQWAVRQQELEELVAKRRREFTMLMYFDARVRLTIQALLTRIQASPVD